MFQLNTDRVYSNGGLVVAAALRTTDLSDGSIAVAGLGLGIDPTRFSMEIEPLQVQPKANPWVLSKEGPLNFGLNAEIVDETSNRANVELGVYRPDLGQRKADKIRMELFDDGFPNAVLEIAKVMSWAQKAKGYKDHDWVNLPDAENGLKGAASRHRRDANSQKMNGVAAKDRVDHESKLHHLAHQAFNVLAELELILTGKIE